MNTQKYIQIEKADGSFYDVTNFVTQCNIRIGDVSGVGEQGNDGVSPTLSLKISCDNNNDFRPSKTNGRREYFEEYILGNGGATYTPKKTNIYPNSVYMYETIGNAMKWSDTTGKRWSDYTGKKWYEMITSSSSYEINAITLNDNGTITFTNAIPNGVIVKVIYSWFNMDYVNPLADLIQSDRLIEVAVKQSQRVYREKSFTSLGGYIFTLSDTDIIPGTIFLKSPIGVIFDFDYTLNQIIFQDNVPNGTNFTVCYSANTGTIRTVFRGLLGDKIRETIEGVELECRDEYTKILQRTPIVYNSDATKSKIRQWSDAILVSSTYYQGYKKYDTCTVSGNVLTKTGASFTTEFSALENILLYNTTKGTIKGSIALGGIINNTTMNLDSGIPDGTYTLFKTYVNGVPLRGFLQFVIDDTIGSGQITVYEPIATNRTVIVKPEYFEYKTLWQLCQAQVNAFGGFIGSRYYSEAEPFRLTILNPDRNKTTADKTLSYKKDFYKQELETSDNGYRDGVIVYYNDANLKTRNMVYAPTTKTILDMVQPMVLDENETYMLTSVTEAQTFANAVYADVQDIPQQSQISAPLNPTVQLFDLLQIDYPYLYTGNQMFAVDSLSFDLMKDTMAMSTSNRIKGGIKKWRNKEARPGKYQPTTTSRITTLGKIPAPTNVTASAYIIENYGQVVTVSSDISWTEPFGYVPAQYQVEYKKSGDTWLKAKVYTCSGDKTSLRVPIEENTEYVIRVTAISKESVIGFYSPELAYTVPLIPEITRTYHIRTQAQFDAWLSSLSTNSGSPTVPTYEKLKIYPLSGGYSYTFGTKRYIQAATFEVDMENVSFTYTNNTTSSLAIAITSTTLLMKCKNATMQHNSTLNAATGFWDLRCNNIEIQGGEYKYSNANYAYSIWYYFREPTTGTRNKFALKNAILNNNWLYFEATTTTIDNVDLSENITNNCKITTTGAGWNNAKVFKSKINNTPISATVSKIQVEGNEYVSTGTAQSYLNQLQISDNLTAINNTINADYTTTPASLDFVNIPVGTLAYSTITNNVALTRTNGILTSYLNWVNSAGATVIQANNTKN